MPQRNRTDYREQIHDLHLPPATRTAWGVRVLGTEGLHRVIAGPPTGYKHTYNQSNFLEWLDPRSGGVAIVLHQQDGLIPELARAPKPASIAETLSNDNTVGESPVRFGGFSSSLSKYVGLRVLAHSDLITAVQIPGIRDYETAFTSVNGAPPDMTASSAYSGEIEGREFIDLINAGLWPYDTHFLDAHAPGLVIGGPEYIAAIRGMTRHVSPASPIEKIDWLGGEIDTYADVFEQVTAASTRVGHFTGCSELGHLYLDSPPSSSMHPVNEVVMKRFNSVLAHHLGITLPASEAPDVVIPL